MVVDSGTSAFRVVLIKEGLAKSGRYFSRRAVEDVARLAEGARAFADHATPSEDRERPVRSVRDLVGFYRDAVVTVAPDGGAQAEATLHIYGGAGWLRCMAEAVCGPPGAGGEVDAPTGVTGAAHGVVGLSIDALAVVKEGRVEQLGRRVPVVEEITELKSVDVVTRPSAGGRFVGLAPGGTEARRAAVEGASGMQDNEGLTVVREVEEIAMSTQRAAGAVGAAGVAGMAVMGVDQEGAVTDVTSMTNVTSAVEGIDVMGVAEAGMGEAVATTTATTTTAGGAGVVGAAEGAEVQAGGEGDVRSLLAEVREAQRALAALLGDDGRGNAGNVGYAGYGGQAVAGATRHPVFGAGRVRVLVSEAEKQRAVAQVAMDRLLGLEGGAAASGQEDADWRRARELGVLAGAPRWLGIREAYVQLTGDALVTGALQPAGSMVREANEVTSGVLNLALLNSMTKRLAADYRGQEQTWRKFASVVPIANFKSQDRVRLSDFASLATVAEGAAYANLAWDDGREIYSPAKRGNLVVVTREAILNDDVRAIRRIPQKLARAAAITINEFVYGLFTSNPLMSNGEKVFDDGVQATHGNRGTTALSAAAVQAAITAMMKQTDSAGKRLNLKPRYLLVPADLLFTALTIVNSTLIPGSANNDANVLKGAVEPIGVAQLTDATDYYLVCDPADVESIEVGFVGGREEPELLLQDSPLHGQVFTNDQISFKIRWEFGGGWLDHRGAYWGNVAG